MTFKEALAESSRRLGRTDEEIQSSMKEASMAVPVPAELLNAPILPEDIEPLIQELMRIQQKVQSNLPLARARLKQKLKDKASNN